MDVTFNLGGVGGCAICSRGKAHAAWANHSGFALGAKEPVFSGSPPTSEPCFRRLVSTFGAEEHVGTATGANSIPFFVPSSPEAYTYDDDGNLASDGSVGDIQTLQESPKEMVDNISTFVSTHASTDTVQVVLLAHDRTFRSRPGNGRKARELVKLLKAHDNIEARFKTPGQYK